MEGTRLSRTTVKNLLKLRNPDGTFKIRRCRLGKPPKSRLLIHEPSLAAYLESREETQ